MSGHREEIKQLGMLDKSAQISVIKTYWRQKKGKN
jgi:hypothetical protein